MQVKPFAQFLHEQRRGVLHEELSEQLQEVVKAVQEHEKPGSLTVKIDVRPGEAGGVLVITDKVTVKAPEAPRKPGLFYADSDGNLMTRDPRQPELPATMHAVKGGADDTNADPEAEAQ